MSSRPILYLLDGHSLAYRHHFAYINNPLMTSKGEPASAVFGFAKNLMDILQKDEPEYIAVTFDDGRSGREILYPEYKGTREKMPDDLSTQMTRIYELVRAFNIPILTASGYEADDVIGTVATAAAAQGADVRIVSGDGDILQLLSPEIRVRLRVRRKNDTGRYVVQDVLYDEPTFALEYGFAPPLLVDYKALKGDTSDNIPGVKGIGDKSATDLIKTFGTLDEIYDNLMLIRGATQRKLEEGRESAYLSRQLATILRDVPVEWALQACVSHDYQRADVEALFHEMEFTSLFKQLDKMPSASASQMALFDMGASSVPSAPIEPIVDTVIVQDEAALTALAAALNSATAIAFDTETTGIDRMGSDLVGIALAVDGERGYYVPVGHQEGEQLPLAVVMDAIRPALTNPNIEKYAHNATYDLLLMQRHGVDVAPIAFDTMVGEWLRDPGSQNLGLKPLVLSRLGVHMTEITDLIGRGKNQVTMDTIPIEQCAPYAAADAALTFRLVEGLRADLAAANLLTLNDTMEMPVIPVIAAMERAGVLLDTDVLAEMGETLGAQMEKLVAEIYATAGMGEFNINSPKQLNDVLFGKLGLKSEGIKKTTHGYSTAANVLDQMRGEHPIIDLILQYRELSKLKGTYVDALPTLINPDTGRVHTDFHQTGTTTGRMSSSNPNLQNIPNRTAMGRGIRKAFITAPNTKLLAVDYSQVELRIMAHITEEPALLEAFEQGQDIHAVTAALVNGVAIEDVTHEQRSFAKRVNFGLLYGMGAFRLTRESGMPIAEARAFIDTYFVRLPGVLQYIESTKQKARDEGYVETLFGRRRYFPQLKEETRVSGFNAVQTAEREAVNMPVQGTAADIMKTAMINLYRELHDRKLGSRIILQVHDELVLEVPEREISEVAPLVIEIMESAYPLKAPLVANASIGYNWLEMQPYSA